MLSFNTFDNPTNVIQTCIIFFMSIHSCLTTHGILNYYHLSPAKDFSVLLSASFLPLWIFRGHFVV